MKLIFKKGGSKPSSLTCLRRDGSRTWTKLRPNFEAHDFIHFVVEKSLGLENAFYGLVEKGTDITAFELPREKRPDSLLPKNFPIESIVAEHIVNLCQIDFFAPEALPDFIPQLKNILSENGLPFPGNLDEHRLMEMRRDFNVLWGKWTKLPAGESIELKW